MITTREAAIDEILGRVRDALPAAAIWAGQSDIEMRWPGIEKTAPDWATYWGRASYQTVQEPQRTLGNTQRLFTTTGLVFVQVFCPQSDVEAQQRGNAIATVFRNAFRALNPSGKVTFRNARIQDNLPPENGSIRFNVVAEYEYDELC